MTPLALFFLYIASPVRAQEGPLMSLTAVQEGLHQVGASAAPPAVKAPEGKKELFELRLLAGRIGERPLSVDAGSAGMLMSVPILQGGAGSLRGEVGVVLTRIPGLDERVSGGVVHEGRLPTDRGVEGVVYERGVYRRTNGPETLELAGLAYRTPRLGPLSLDLGVRGGIGVPESRARVVEQESYVIGGRRSSGPETLLQSPSGRSARNQAFIAAHAGANLHLGGHLSLNVDMSRPVLDRAKAGGARLRGGLTVGF